MKKLMIAVAVLALLLVSAPLFAAEAGEIHYGIKAGGIMAKAWGDDVPDEASWKFGVNAGAFMNYRLNDMFVVQPEAFYAMKGWKYDISDEDLGDYSVNVKLDYIDIDVLAKLTVPMEGKIKPAIFVGPYVGIKASAKMEVEDVSEDIDNAKSTDFGVVLGGEVGYELGNGMMILLDVRYSMGMVNIFDVPEDAPAGTEAPNVKNQALIFMAGVAF
jgi:hypothetical protein